MASSLDNDSQYGFQRAEPAPAPATASVQTRVSGDTTRVTSSDLQPRVGGVLATARNNAGFPTRNYDDTTSVEIPGGMRTSLANAVQLGYLRKDGAGNYSNVGKEDQGPDRGKVEQQGDQRSDQHEDQQGGDNDSQRSDQRSEDEPVPFDNPGDEAQLGAFVQHFSGDLQRTLIERAIAGDDIDPRIAEEAGMTRENFTAGIKTVMHNFTMQAKGYLARKGIDLQEFTEWAQAERPAELKDAMRRHAGGRTPQVYANLAEQFFRSTVPSVEELQKAGFQPEETKEHGLMITYKGRRMLATVAARLGFI